MVISVCFSWATTLLTIDFVSLLYLSYNCQMNNRKVDQVMLIMF